MTKFRGAILGLNRLEERENPSFALHSSNINESILQSSSAAGDRVILADTLQELFQIQRQIVEAQQQSSGSSTGPMA